MPIRLFYRTTREVASAILREGFRDGEDGAVWFSHGLDCMGEQDRHLLAVTFDLAEAELEAFAVEATLEDWDEATGQWVASTDVASLSWFKIPAAVVNSRGRVRLTYPRPEDDFWR